MGRLPRRVLLPLSSGFNILPGHSRVIEARSQLEDFRPDRILIKNSERWAIGGIKVQGRPQLTGDRPPGLFSLRGAGAPLEMSRIPRGGRLEVRATYAGPGECGEPFECCVFGTTEEWPSTERREADRAVLTLSASASVDDLGNARLVLPPRTEEFWPEHLVVSEPRDWVILDIRVNGLSCMVQSGDLPGVMFAEGEMNPPLRIGPVSPRDELDVLAFYAGAGRRSEARLECTLSGPRHGDDVSPGAMRLMPMSSGVNILPNASAQITSRPRDHVMPGQVFRPRRIVLDGAEDWMIDDVKVGVVSQFAQSGDVPGVAFAADAVDTLVALDPVQHGIDFVIIATYVGSSESGAAFVCGVAGEVVEVDSDSAPTSARARARRSSAR